MFIKTHSNSESNKSSGFTLIEMAISLIIIGLLLGSATHYYNLYIEKKRLDDSRQAISRATTAIFAFKNTHGRFPCPSPIKEARTSPNYGHETNCSDPTIGTGTPINPGECLNGTVGPDFYNGICVEVSNRLIGASNPRVRVGSIPFRDIQLEETDVVDGYGSRLVYAITENMAVAATFKDSEGGIELRDAAGTNTLSSGNKSIAFIVISPGQNKNGAITKEGTETPCNTSASLLDSQNCRDFTSTTDTQSVYAMDVQMAGNNQFDDFVEYFSQTEKELWRRQTPTSENILDTSEKSVGVGASAAAAMTDELVVEQSTVNNPSSTGLSMSLAATNTTGGNHQSGGLRVGKFSGGTQSGAILADSYCTKDGLSCFSVDRIGKPYDGNPVSGTDGMGCPSGEYMIGIGNGKAICAPVRVSCPAGQALTGFNVGTGSPICTTPAAGCPLTTKLLCGSPQSLSAGGNTQTRTVTHTNFCANATYQCVSGAWTLLSSYATTYACNYNNASPTTGSTPGVACGAGYSGTYTQSFYFNCSGNKVNTTNTSSTDCTCIGKTDPVYCPSGFGVNVVAGNKKRLCTGSVLNATYTVFTGNDLISYPTEAALQAANCSCTKSEFWDFTTVWAKTRTTSPTPPSFSSPTASWPPNTSYCSYRKVTVDSSTCTYNYGAWDNSNCVCAAGTQSRLQNPTCGSCQEVNTQSQIRQIRSGASCDWTDDPDTSANVAGTCKAINYVWKSSGNQAAPATPLANGRGGNPVCGSSCTCAQNGSSGICALSTATDWTFYSSTCQPQ